MLLQTPDRSIDPAPPERRENMAKKLLVGIREDHYLLLKALLDLCDLGMDEFTDLITSHTDELEAFLQQLKIDQR